MGPSRPCSQRPLPEFRALAAAVRGRVLGLAGDCDLPRLVGKTPEETFGVSQMCTATAGPLYGNATTNLLEFDDQGNFVRELGQGVYGLGYGHAVRFDLEDNLWVVDKGTNAVTKFDPSGYVVLNLGRRPEGFDHYEHVAPENARHVDGYFAGPTDVGWHADGNIYVSDGYIN